MSLSGAGLSWTKVTYYFILKCVMDIRLVFTSRPYCKVEKQRVVINPFLDTMNNFSPFFCFALRMKVLQEISRKMKKEKKVSSLHLVPCNDGKKEKGAGGKGEGG